MDDDAEAYDWTTEDRARPADAEAETPGNDQTDMLHWTCFLTCPRGPDNRPSVRYTNDAGDVVFNLAGAMQYHAQHNLPFHARDFNFQVDDNEPRPTPRPRTTATPVTSHPSRSTSHNDVQILFTQADPQHYKEAMSTPARPKWEKAMSEEIETMRQRDVYDEMPMPPDTKVLGTHWVFKTKRDNDGNIKRYRARLVVQGNRQRFYWSSTAAGWMHIWT